MANWTLPPPFAALLSAPLEQAVESLIGPVPKIKENAVEDTASASKPIVPFLEALKIVPDALTDNGANAYSSTDSALVDLFYDFTPGVSGEDLFERLDAAWKADPVVTLKIIFHARSIHEGKGFKTGFFRAVAWVWEYHPHTLLANLHLIVQPTCERARSKKRDAAKAQKESAANNGVEVLDDDGNVGKDVEPEYPPRPHGSFDDLNDILVLAINGQLTVSYTGRMNAFDQALAPAYVAQAFKRSRVLGQKHLKREAFETIAKEAKSDMDTDTTMVKARTADVESENSEVTTLVASDEASVGDKRKAGSDETFARKLSRCGSKQMRAAVLQERAYEALSSDKKLQALYLAVIDLFATYISADLDRLAAHTKYISLPQEQRAADGYAAPNTSPYLFGMSYAAKWAPTPGKSADKQLHMATALACRLFPSADVKTARHKLQTQVLAPLRRVLAVPEVAMVNGPWKIEYTKVPAMAMARHQAAFDEHDPEGFGTYLDQVASGKVTISGASMFPHEIVCNALTRSRVERRVANVQWDALVDSIRSSSNKELSNCIAVADVSGSMGSLSYTTTGRVSPIGPCISLTLLLTELARPPWNGAFITFSSDPKIQHVDNTQTLTERVHSLSRAAWGLSTDYYKVFTAILSAATNAQLKPEDMVKKIFVFSDMQFDASGGSAFGETEHSAVARLFEDAGYPMPELVYWNLEAASARPVKSTTPGVALVSGFSGALMKYFIKALGDEPEEEEEDAELDDWEDVGETKAEPKEKKDKKQKEGKEGKNPMDHLLAIVGAKSFEGVVVVD